MASRQSERFLAALEMTDSGEGSNDAEAPSKQDDVCLIQMDDPERAGVVAAVLRRDARLVLFTGLHAAEVSAGEIKLGERRGGEPPRRHLPFRIIHLN